MIIVQRFLVVLLSILMLIKCTSLYSENNKYEEVKFKSFDNAIVKGKLWYPKSQESDIIVIDVKPSLAQLPPDSVKIERLDVLLRQALINKGMFYFEFSGRKGSVMKYGIKYPLTSLITKSEDLNSAIRYLKSYQQTRNKKIVLLGTSEGGMSSAVSASKEEVDGVVFISTPAVNGEEFTTYQSLCRDSLFMETFGRDTQAFNTVTTLFSGGILKYEKSYAGFHRFREETFGPLKEILYKYTDYDTIAFHIMKYLDKEWAAEDSITKSRLKDFNNYCMAHKHVGYIQPQQIEIYKWEPELYFPKIKCPVLSIYGDEDRNIEYLSSKESMKKLLLEGGNSKCTFLVLKGFDHTLQKNRKYNKDICRLMTDWILSIRDK